MGNDLDRIAALLLENGGGKADWGDISHLKGVGCPKGVANRFLLCCLLDWQSDADVAWRKGHEARRSGRHLDDNQLLLKRSMGFEIRGIRSAAPVSQGLQASMGNRKRHLRSVRWRRSENLGWQVPFRGTHSSLGARCRRSNFSHDRRRVAGLRSDQGRLRRRKGRPSHLPCTRSRSLWRRNQGFRSYQGHPTGPHSERRPVESRSASVERRKILLPTYESELRKLLLAAAL